MISKALPPSALFRLQASAARFMACRSGSLPIFFALTSIPMLIFAGVAVDYSRSTNMVARAQAAADAAVLGAGAKPAATHEQRQTIAANIVNGVFGASAAALNLHIVETDVNAATYEVTISGRMSTILSRLTNQDGVSFSATARATSSSVTSARPLEMALALDNTGSMANNMADLKTAARTLVQTVMQGGGNAARVSVVPYVAVVNPGLTDAASIANYIDTTAMNPWAGSWLRWAWLTHNPGCAPAWGPGNGGVGGGGSGDARDILDILKPIRNLAQELFGISSAHAADITPNTIAPLTTYNWRSPSTGVTYKIPTGFQGLARNGSDTAGCEWLVNPQVVAPYELLARMRDQNGGPVGWKGCVEARLARTDQNWLNSNWGYNYPRTIDYDLTDTTPTTSDPTSLFTPYFWSDEPDYSPFTGSYVAPGPYSPTTQGFRNNYLPDGQIPTNWGWDQQLQLDWGGAQRILKYDGVTRSYIQETPDAGGYTYGPNAGCPDRVLRLTNNQGDVLGKIAGLAFWQSGGTVISEGLMWAWRTLSPNAPYADAAPYNTPGVTKAIVLMTDGVNELIDNGNNATSQNTPNFSDYSAYGYLGDVRLWQAYGTKTYTQVNSLLNSKLLTACTNAKAAGVQIYAVTFNHAGYLTSQQQTDAQNLLRSCASSPSNAYLATDAASLNTAFSAIAVQASGGGALRLIR